MSDSNNIFRKGDRVESSMEIFQTVFGRVQNPKTGYGRVEVLWDDDRVEDTHVREWDLKRVTPEEERDSAIEEAQRLLDRHGLSYTISGKDDEVLATSE